MHHNLREIYGWTLKKYKKFRERYHQSLATGRFYGLTRKKQLEIINRLHRIANRLRQLKLQLKIAAATGTISLVVSLTPAQSQELGPFVRNQPDNPFRRNYFSGYQMKPTLADLDNDGDHDIAMGSGSGYIIYLENIGTSTNPIFEERSGFDNPFDAIITYGHSGPELVDFDGDGDFDLIVADNDYVNDIQYFQNLDFEDDGIIGNSPNFSTESTLPNVRASYHYPKVSLADIDNDGDFDLLLGQTTDDSNNALHFFRNDAGFSQQPVPAGLEIFNTYPLFYRNLTPTFFDYDDDGDFDLFLGLNNGEIRYFKNTDLDPSDPSDDTIGDNIAFVEQTGAANPFDGIITYDNSVISFSDLDGDGDEDVLICSRSQRRYFTNESGSFTEQTGFNNPFNGFDVGDDASPTFIDIDNDGDLDAVVGSKYGRHLTLMQNNNGIFKNLTGSGTDFDDLTFGNFASSPAFADVDGDGDYDLFLGFTFNPAMSFLRNTGTSAIPSLSNEGNILGLATYYGNENSPTLGDLDGDGDFDLVLGSGNQGEMRYFEGLDTSPTFVERVGSSNPLNGLSVGTAGYYRNAKPELIDIDHDGDLDLVVGIHSSFGDPLDGRLSYFQNDGNGNFTQLTGIANPFDGITSISEVGDVEPAFADLDNDGDLDLYLGNSYGQIEYFENQNLPVQVSGNAFSVTHFENSPTVIDPSIALSDDGNDDISSATISIIENYNSGDLIEVTLPGGVNSNFDTSTGTLTLTGLAKLSVYETILNSATFTTIGDNPPESTRIIEFVVWDFDNTDPRRDQSPELQVEVYVTPVNDAPIVSVNNNAIYVENDGPKQVISELTINDPDNTDLSNVIISISSGYNAAEDLIAFIDQNGITGNFNSGTGTLTLTGSASVAAYQAAIESITYQNTSENPDITNRTFTILVNDGIDDGNAVEVDVSITSVNDAPTVVSSSGDNTFIENSAPIIVDDNLSITDVDHNTLTGAIVSIVSKFPSEADYLIFSDQNGISGSYDDASGILTLNGTATIDDYMTALRSITFENTSENPDVTTRVITFLVNDGIDISNSSVSTIDITAVNDAPLLASTNSGTIEYTTNSAAIIIDNAIDVTDVDNVQFSEAAVSVAGYITGDLLVFFDQQGIAGSFDNQTGVLSFTGTADEISYENILRSVSFFSSNDTGSRTITFTISDGTDFSNSISRSVNIANTGNLPPVVNTTPQSTQSGSIVVINWCDIINDPDNLDSELTVTVQSTLSGALTSVEGCEIIIDYSNTNFSGQDQIVIQACDPSNACGSNTLNIEVEDDTTPPPTNTLVIFNAISPNSDGSNDTWEITNLTAPNNIELFNRWGDLVLTLTDYVSKTEGTLDDLSTGTYFYKIESPQGSYTGFIVIKK